jgi:uncharacterized protein (TIGR00290 family)
MTEKEKALLSWSGGKDSAMALYELRVSGRYEVVSLLTTVAREYGRISHHGVRVELLERQAAALGMPLHIVELPAHECTNEVYEAAMAEALQPYLDAGVRTVAFGDIFLRDLREYREQNLARVGMRGVFPIWERDTTELVKTFLELGFKARVACVDAEKLDASFAGRPLDRHFLDDLPGGIDPCGENGEFHTFVYDGPLFSQPVPVEVGDTVTRDGRHFADLVPATADAIRSAAPSRRGSSSS